MKRIDIKTPDGKPILSLHFVEQGAGGNNNRTNASGNNRSYGNNAKRQNNNNNDGGNGQQDSDNMSDAQKRYLFRILAEQGLEGDAAFAHLKERLGVENLASASKRDASALIEELLGSPAAS
jgi:hypothetical protein